MNIGPELRRIKEIIDKPEEGRKQLQLHFDPDNRAGHIQLFSEILACRLGVDECIDMFVARIIRIAEPT